MPRKKKNVNDASSNAPRSLQQKLELAEALVAKYKKQIAAEAIVNNIEVGDDVDFLFGRGDKKQTLTGKVTIGITELPAPGGKVVGVEAGEGFDKQVYKVRIGDLTANRTAEGRVPAGLPQTEADPLLAE